jgi:hypothetical protein
MILNFLPSLFNFKLFQNGASVVRSGNDVSLIDFTNLSEGQYFLFANHGTSLYRALVNISNDLPGHVGIVLSNESNELVLYLPDKVEGEPILVRKLDQNRALIEQSYQYSQEIRLGKVKDGNIVTIAKPSQNSVDFRIQAVNELFTVNGINLFEKKPSLLNAYLPESHVTGAFKLNYTSDGSDVFAVQLRDKSSGNISTWYTDQKYLDFETASGAFEWRVLGVQKNFPLLENAQSKIDAISGGWQNITVLPSDYISGKTTTIDSNSVNYFKVLTQQGIIVESGKFNGKLDWARLTNQSYIVELYDTDILKRKVSLSRNADDNSTYIAVESLGDGKLKFYMPDNLQGSPFYVQVVSIDGGYSNGFYAYGSTVDIVVPDGNLTYYFAKPGEVYRQLDFTVDSGLAVAVEGFSTMGKADWFLPLLRTADTISPIVNSTGLGNFSFFAPSADKYVMQLRDEHTRTVNTYLSDNGHIDIFLGEGQFSWRVFAAPVGLDLRRENIDILSTLKGGWRSFSQSSQPRSKDYILGYEPDKIRSVDELQFTYPSDALRLDDGSTLVANTYGANVWKIEANGSVARVAGGFSEGYIASGQGQDVLLKAPVRFFQISQSEILFSDTQNFVIRKLNLITGVVSTVYGNPANSAISIVNGVLESVGEVQDIGRDDLGNLYISAAGQILRQNSSGSWYNWDFALKTSSGIFSIVDVLFEQGAVYALVHDREIGRKKYFKFDGNGQTLGVVDVGVGYGSGLVKDPITGKHLVGNHTSIVTINPDNLSLEQYSVPDSFANIALMSVREGVLTVTDSDAGKIYDFDLTTRKKLNSIGASSGISNVVVDLATVNGNLLALDNQSPRVLEFKDDRVEVILGTGKQGTASVSLGSKSTLAYPNAITADPQGNIYIVESNHRILKLASNGTLSSFAGSIYNGYSGDGGLATEARFTSVYGIDFSNDKLFVADSFNHSIRYIDNAGVVHRLVGNGKAGLGVGLVGNGAALNTPLRVLNTSDNRLFISDSWNNRIVEYDPIRGITPIAGIGFQGTYQGQGNFSGDGGSALQAELNAPVGLAYYAEDRTLVFADSFNNRIRYVDSGGDIHTLIGKERGYKDAELLNLPSDVEIIGNDLFIADTGNSLVLEVKNFDRTGNDFGNALNVRRAEERLGSFTRSEHVDLDDNDFYFVGGLLDKVLRVRTHAELNLGFFDADGGLLAAEKIQPGSFHDFQIKDFQFVSVQGNNVAYDFTLAPSQTITGTLAEDMFPTNNGLFDVNSSPVH